MRGDQAQISEYKKVIAQINEIGREISTSTFRNPSELFESVYRALSEIMDVSSFYVANYNRVSEIVEFVLAYEEGKKCKVGIGEWKKRKNGKGLTEYVIKSKEPILLNENLSDWMLDNKIQFYGTESKSFLAVPIFYKEFVTGVIGIQNHYKENAYDNFTIDKLRTIAIYIEIAIRNIELEKNYSHNLASSNHFIQNISSSLELSDLQEKIITEIKKELGCTHCTIYLYVRRKDGEYLEPDIIEAKPNDKKSILKRRFKISKEDKKSEGLVGYVFETGESAIFINASEHPRFAEATKFHGIHPRTMLIVPIHSGGDVRGLICADNDTNEWFTEENKIWVDNIALNIGIAIERTLIFEKLRENSKRLIANIKSEDINTILSKIIEGALTISNARAGIIYLFGPRKKNIIHTYEYPLDSNFPTPRRDDSGYLCGITRLVVDSKQIIDKTDADLYPKFVSPRLINRKEQIIGVPIIIKNNVKGVFFLVDKYYRNYSEIEKVVLRILAEQAAQVITATKNIEQKHSIQLETIKKISATIPTSNTLKNSFEEILSWTLELMGNASIGAIEIVDQNGISGPLIYSGKEIDKKYKKNVYSEGGLVNDSLKNKKIINMGDVKKVDGYLPLRDDINSELVIPLIHLDRVIGVLNIEHWKKNAFKNYHERLGEAIAGYLVILYENSILYSELQNSLDKLEQTQEELIDRERALAVSTYVRDIIHDLNNQIGTIPRWVNLARYELENNNKNKVLEYLAAIQKDAIKLLNSSAAGLRVDLSESEFDIVQLFNSKIAEFSYLCPERITLIYHPYEFKYMVFGNEVLLSQAVSNLLYNAINAISDKGYIRISLSLDSQNENLLAEIEDNGSGIPVINRETIFNYGSSYWKNKKGNGYGLWRSRSIIEGIGGELSYKPNEPTGSVFSITFPVFSQNIAIHQVEDL